MSTIQVSNVHLESSGNCRIQYTGSNTITMYAGGVAVATLAVNVVLDLGNSGTGTITPNPGDRQMQKYTNTGAHTLAPGSTSGNYMLDILNSGTAGAINTSGWTVVAGDPFTTTNGHKFRCSASVTSDGSVLSVIALQ